MKKERQFYIYFKYIFLLFIFVFTFLISFLNNDLFIISSLSSNQNDKKDFFSEFYTDVESTLKYKSDEQKNKNQNSIKEFYSQELVLSFNKPLLKQFIDNGFEIDQARQIFNEMNLVYDLRKLKAGNIFKIEYLIKREFEIDHSKEKIYPFIYKKKLIKNITDLYFKSETGVKINVHYNNLNHKYEAKMSEPVYRYKTKIEKINITTNLFTDASILNINPSIIYKILNQYSFSVDFQRDIRIGDSILIILESKIDEEGDVISEKLLYSNLILSKKDNEIFLFEDNFYSRDGKSIVKELLLTPIDGGRISSGFSLNRKHPILGYSRAHKGIDFAAPKGTPIQAAGDGVVIYAGWKGAYGKFVSLRHNDTYITNYAHLSKIPEKIKNGRRVKQKEVIGFLGDTGLATGPHLHYEVVKRGLHINPKSLKKLQTSSKKISTEKIDLFKEKIDIIDKIIYENKNRL